MKACTGAESTQARTLNRTTSTGLSFFPVFLFVSGDGASTGPSVCVEGGGVIPP